MKAVWFEQGQAGFRDLPEPKAGPGLALVKPLWAGICNTDLELLAGYYDFAGVPGHEFVGQVREAPDRPELAGRLVVADINIACGHCAQCRQCRPHHCLNRRTIGIKEAQGAFAELLPVPLQNLYEVPQGVLPQAAAFAEPLAAALQIARQVHLGRGERVLVLGDGKLGLLCALALAPFSTGLVLAGRHGRKLDLVRAQGVQTVLLPRETRPGEIAGELGKFPVVVEATGNPQGLELALDLCQPLGTIVAKTTSHLEGGFPLARLVVEEIRLQGSRCGDMGQALAWLAAGRLDPAPLVEEVFPFAEFPRALARAGEKGALKVLLDMGG